MIKYIVLILTSLTLSLAQAALETDTHTYIVFSDSNTLLVIDRMTGEEKELKVGECPTSIVIHEDFGYVVNYGSHDISVIDLKTHSIIRTIPVEDNPLSMTLHRNLGFVLSKKYKMDMNDVELTISALDLSTYSVIKKIFIVADTNSIVIHKDNGYVVNKNFSCINIIDLLNCSLRYPSIHVSKYPQHMVVHRDDGYVVNFGSNDVSVIDLRLNGIIKTIPVGCSPKSMVIHKNLGYVVNSYSNNVSVLDLHTNAVTNTIPVKNPTSMVIHKDLGYITSKADSGWNYDPKDNRIFVINLQTLVVIERIPNPNNLSVNFSDTHLYLGSHPYKSFKLHLFKYPYPGVMGFYLDQDPEDAFEKFEAAALRKDFSQTTNNFNIAMSHGHKKACAVAFYAFVHGIWGATYDDFWVTEFMKNMDVTYLSRLDHEKASPFDLKLKPEALPFLAKMTKSKKR